MYKLGKLPKKFDKRNLKLSNYLKEKVEFPKYLDWTKGVTQWGMMSNDVLGCCTCSTAGHKIQGWTLNDAMSMITLSNNDIVKAYMEVSGYDGTPQTDNGAYVLDLLKYWKNVGIGGHKIDAFVEVDVKNIDLIKTAIYLFGSVYTGIELPLSCQNQLIWDVPWYGTWFNGAKGSWGGHALSLHGYGNNLIGVTWAKRQMITERFFSFYGSEAYAVLSIADWLGADNKAPNLFDLNKLEKDLKEVSK